MGAIPKPVQAPAQTVLDEVTNGYEPKSNIEHGALCTFAEHFLAVGKEPVHEKFGIDNLKLAEIVDGAEPFLLHFGQSCGIGSGIEGGKALHMGVSVSFIFSFGCGGILHVAETETIARSLVSIGGTDTFARCADFGITFGFFAGGVEQTVCGKNQMGLARKLEYILKVNARFLKRLGFLAEEHGVEHHAIADDIGLAVLENARKESNGAHISYRRTRECDRHWGHPGSGPRHRNAV